MSTQKQINEKVEYKLFYTYKGQEYCNCQVHSVCSTPTEFYHETIALSLLLGDIDCHKFNRNDIYTNLRLVEIDKNGSAKSVWESEAYKPDSINIDPKM